ncbi:Pre-mRNA splicing factor SR-like 1 [Vitis vinifera]|uniref:Pre-mRNA splicing factor SR-like 1 n=1 Tax=Vitis vinifera TaxID=29760 RepID=A0A438EIQ4_VITVI|nr:Pre-mRNA splicing factor SR-like 1 [Vitis vinifera]
MHVLEEACLVLFWTLHKGGRFSPCMNLRFVLEELLHLLTVSRFLVLSNLPPERKDLIRMMFLLQYYFDTLFPRIPVPIMRQIVANLEKMKLPSKHAGVTGDTTRHGSDDTARRPPSVKAALSVSFGQRAPHRASTRDSSPVRRTLPPPPPSYDRNSSDDLRRSPSSRRSQSRELSDREYSDRDRDTGKSRELDRDRDHDRERDRERDRTRNRDKDRDRAMDRDRDRDKGRDRDRDRDKDKDRDRDRDRERERTETGGMIMIADPSIQKEKAEGTMTEALVMAVGTTEKLVPVEVGVGAEAEVRACKLAMTTLIIVQVHSQMGAKRRPLHLPIWRSSEICMVTQVIKKGAVPWKEAVVGTIAVKR